MKKTTFTATTRTALALFAGVMICSTATAQSARTPVYRSVSPQGTVIYTDRPATPQSRVPFPTEPSRAGMSIDPNNQDIPFMLRQKIARNPVTLYTQANCLACDKGRELLRERGIPFLERSSSTAADKASLRAFSGSAVIPVLVVGNDIMPGFSETDWNRYLTTSGFPKTSELPASFAWPDPIPMSEPDAQPAAAPEVTSPDTTAAP